MASGLKPAGGNDGVEIGGVSTGAKKGSFSDANAERPDYEEPCSPFMSTTEAEASTSPSQLLDVLDDGIEYTNVGDESPNNQSYDALDMSQEDVEYINDPSHIYETIQDVCRS